MEMLKGAGSGAVSGSAAFPWGTVVGAVVGAGVGLWKGIMGNKAKAKEADSIAQQETDAKNETDRVDSIRRDYIGASTDLNGNDYSQRMFAAFGNKEIAPIQYTPEKINGAEPINSTASVVKGPSHEEGGIPLNSVSDDPHAEMEGEEVIVKGKDGNPEDSMIFSARLATPDGGTFAQWAGDFSKSKGDNEKQMTETLDKYKVYSLERENEIIDTQLAKLFKLQGLTKEQQEQSNV